MAWPKKGTRRLVVDGIDFSWHYTGHCPCCSDDVITVGIAGKPYVLFIDPFPWKFELRPSHVASAIRWAIKNGWSPDGGPTKALSLDYDKDEFVWLPEGKRHMHCNG